MKKLLFNKSVMLCLVMLAGYCVNVTAQNFTAGGINYAVNVDKKTVKVGENRNVEGPLNIPATVTYNKKTYSVTEIGWSAFEGCRGLTQVTIPNSVTEIGGCAFVGCSGLTQVTIPNSVTGIGDYAFKGCSGLTQMTIPNSVTEIGLGAFYGCSGLTQMTIPNSVTSIGGYAFSGCSGLTQVTIPNSVTEIGSDAFEGCSGLTLVSAPRWLAGDKDEMERVFGDFNGTVKVNK